MKHFFIKPRDRIGGKWLLAPLCPILLGILFIYKKLGIAFLLGFLAVSSLGGATEYCGVVIKLTVPQ
jgi:hypothetical protein